MVIQHATVSVFPESGESVRYKNKNFPAKYDYIGKTKKQALEEIADFLISDFEAEFNLKIMKD
jgi:hypothetical protein